MITTQANTAPEPRLDAHAVAPAGVAATRPMYWSLRRELWENRSIIIAPLAVAALMMFGFAVSLFHLPERRRALLLLDQAKQHAAIQKPYDIMAIVFIANAFIVGVFYCLDALHAERRDRSILFWKSLPVSDLTTVLAKASIPLVVLPLFVFALTVVTQLTMLMMTTVVLFVSGLGGATSAHWAVFDQSLILLYGFVILTLWHAPLYGWLLLISAWSRRSTFLWAILPPLAVAVIEKVALGSSHLASLFAHRFLGHVPLAFDLGAKREIDSLAQLTPGNFLSTPGLWIGLVLAAAFLAGTVRLRRERGPI
jgi:ABC-2 type transport system permease protein